MSVEYAIVASLLCSILLAIFLVGIRWWRSPVEMSKEEFLEAQDLIDVAVQEMRQNGWTYLSGDFSGATFEKTQNGERLIASIELSFIRRQRNAVPRINIWEKDEHGQIKHITKNKEI